ncbi:NADP-dependent 3-hydroxy acid dehydrogenase YdfG [Bradyrhizobium sp. R2.2-H]|jgi:NADP-dependent 3-hydroxy acid dehydrogenase YdfG|uniref:SDR family oxidoreductase n=1 Tax=unclassified Bradyrhizobium TaxID=2631580 RepID=UPI001050C9CD|nr:MULTISPECIES: SDR family oxidoreductase [unclassified Bradyrhizobium]TCU72199.1 NADP-dependent 3-hydroxy acid dehydrogenase YdfG [Bradyrhizobium sp. Y-H1]TCU74320.1 NADP-dependent 3-hydroxy acid dehydrogenase YdfG [Bradyrhizobium sp. R2.2-H]
MSKKIEGKIVAITGASSGIGAETAKLLASKGAIVAIGARRRQRLDAIVAEIERAGGRGKAYTVDVVKRVDVANFIEGTVKDFGRIDVLVNNAGVMPIAALSECRIDEWDRMIDVNIRGVLHGIAAALPVFQRQKSGQFVNLSSVLGFKVFAPGGTVYSATKFAIRAISDGLRVEAGDGIRVASIEPGIVDSELKHNTTGAAKDMVMGFYQQAIPAESVARAIAYAIEQPADVDISEIVVRSTGQPL